MSQASALEQYLLELVNGERAQAGVQPLAFDDRLNAAAEDHSRWMIATDTFSHTGAAGSSAGDRMRAAGYAFSGAWTWGENIAWATTRSPAGLQDEVQLLHTNLMNSPGHRANLLNGDFREIGLGFEVGDYLGRESAFVTEDFARSGTALLLTGVAYADRDGDGRFDAGEGLAGISVTAVSDGVQFASMTQGAGGYDLALPPGTYSVTFAGSGYEPRTLQATVAAGNVKLDLVNPLAMRDDVAGTAGNDRLAGSGGNDRLRGLAGDDFIDGGPGNDTAVYGGQRSEYVVRWGGDAALVSSARDGNDRLVRVEALEFADRTEHVTTRPLEYIASYVDLANAFGTDAARGFDHYMAAGFREGRSVGFSGLEYIASYGDLAAWLGPDTAGGAAHYIAHGRFEGRKVTFDGLEYVASYPDLVAWLGANAEGGAAHYIAHGRLEGRTTTFDGLQYIASYDDLIRGLGADETAGAAHFILHGRNEGRTTSFDGLEYIASYGDLIAWLGANAEGGAVHYIRHGFDESRHISFDPAQYLANYADLRAAFGQDERAATIHYINHGHAEGRTDHVL